MSWSRSSRSMSPPISGRSARILKSRPSSSTWPRSACCSTGWSSARWCDQSRAIGARAEARGETRQDPVLTPEEARKLLDSIDVTTVVGLRDRALIAHDGLQLRPRERAVAMRVEDIYPRQALVGAAARKRRQAA